MNVQLADRHNDSGSGAKGPIGVMELDVTPDGSRVVALGNFKHADGLLRDQIVMITTSGASAVVTPDWATQRYTPYCSKGAFDSYVRDVAFSPDGSFLVGRGSSGGPNAGTLCDSAARFETYAVGTALQPTWADYTGGDTLWGVEVTDSAVYVGGHMRWMNNISGRDSAAQGAVPRPGIAALSVSSGVPLDWNPGRHPRGEAVYTLLATDNGLYFGTDTDWVGNFEYERPRVGFFPFAGGHEVADDSLAALPADVLTGSPGLSGDSLVHQSFDGATFGARTTLASPGISWSKVRARSGQEASSTTATTTGSSTAARTRRGFSARPSNSTPTTIPYWLNLPTGSGLVDLHRRGAVAVRQLQQLRDRAGLPQPPSLLHPVELQPVAVALLRRRLGHRRLEVFSATNGIAWNDAALAFASGNDLYYAVRSTGQLRKVALVNDAPSGAAVTVDTSRDWRGRRDLPGAADRQRPARGRFTQTCLELDCTFDATRIRRPGRHARRLPVGLRRRHRHGVTPPHYVRLGRRPPGQPHGDR